MRGRHRRLDRLERALPERQRSRAEVQVELATKALALGIKEGDGLSPLECDFLRLVARIYGVDPRQPGWQALLSALEGPLRETVAEGGIPARYLPWPGPRAADACAQA